MSVGALVPLLALFTFGAVIVFAVVSRYRVKQRMNDDEAPESSLARRRPDPNFTPDVRETRKDIFPDR